MLIPSIDLMNGRVVQLVQGEQLAFETEDVQAWIDKFSAYPVVQLIDLDAAMDRGDNHTLVRRICAALPCQVGGGIRTVDAARRRLDDGARRVIVGSALFDTVGVRIDQAAAFEAAIGHDPFRMPARFSRRSWMVKASSVDWIAWRRASSAPRPIGNSSRPAAFAISRRSNRSMRKGLTPSWGWRSTRAESSSAWFRGSEVPPQDVQDSN
jgi:hypothetical protein